MIQDWLYCRWQKFRGWKVSWFTGLIRYVAKSFVLFSSPLLSVHLWFSNSLVSTKASCSLREFSLKLSLAYSEMDESTLLTHVWADRVTLSRITMQSQEENSYWSESKMKHIANRFLVSFFCKFRRNPLDSLPLLWNISLNISKFFMVSTFSRAKV